MPYMGCQQQQILSLSGLKSATALVDTGSDASFINSKFVVKSKCAISEIDVVTVAAANGQEMTSNTVCQNCMFTIQGHDFTSTFRLLDVR